jgi:hypothetical protein
MRTITLEEHYATEAFMEGPGRELKAQAEAARSHPQVAAGYEKLIEQLCDLGGGRKPAMDEGKIALASKLMRDRETPVSAVCEAVGVSRATLYRYVGPDGTPRAR